MNIAAIVAYIPFLFLTLFFVFNERELITSCGYGVLDFELAWTSATIDKIFAAWGPVEMHYQAFATYVDFLYIACYALFGALLILILTRRLGGGLREFGLWIVLAPVLAGVCDVVENVFLLSMLNRGADVGWHSPFFASLCASFKIAFLAAGLCFMYIAVLILLSGKLKMPMPLLYLTLLGSGVIIVWLFTLWNLFAAVLFGAVYYLQVLLAALLIRAGSGHGVGPPHAA